MCIKMRIPDQQKFVGQIREIDLNGNEHLFSKLQTSVIVKSI